MVGKEIRGDDVENFPVGMRVLAVDDDRTCLMVLKKLLQKCQYNTTVTSNASTALKMLRSKKYKFDLVISDVEMPHMDGFKFLEQVGLEMDIPVIMLSAHSDPKLVARGVTHGACDYLLKPVSIEQLKNIWQHVYRRKKTSDGVQAQGSHLAGNKDKKRKYNLKRKGDEVSEDEDDESQKKPRVIWTLELHTKFVDAIHKLGIQNVVPKTIRDMMNVDGITRENVASHLQKYRMMLRRLSEAGTQQASLGANDSFMHMKMMDNHGLSRVSRYTNGGMLGRLNTPRNLTPSTLVQPTQAASFMSSLGKMRPVLPDSSHSPSLFQGIQSSPELDQLQQNKGAAHFNTMNNSRMSTTSSTSAYLGSSNKLLKKFGNSQLMRSDKGYFILNQSSDDMPSLTTGVSGPPTIPDPGKCNGNWQNDPHVESSTVHLNSWNGTYVQNNDMNQKMDMVLPPFEDSMGGVHHMNQVPGQTQNGIMSNSGQSSGIMNQNMDMHFCGISTGNGGSALMQQQNDDGCLERDGSMPNGDFDFYFDFDVSNNLDPKI